MRSTQLSWISYGSNNMVLQHKEVQVEDLHHHLIVRRRSWKQAFLFDGGSFPLERDGCGDVVEVERGWEGIHFAYGVTTALMIFQWWRSRPLNHRTCPPLTF